ncbi:class I SAM-dependent methyltransferase [Novosphingobium album (ex Hu et al. 2023)]|uniref:Methyltransferase n=1 Tax=Novosphingobium album (ex Hu et al. 2023) TaxID=2930093 RepID=A0ABT0AWU6_9SPHN|nr:methyltransferase [Novosphingobium album (ex Hu et al. 2023)]MCJ2177307.1 methyltransferase [Novosphingobium album (ex Hu et al. 2023)]
MRRPMLAASALFVLAGIPLGVHAAAENKAAVSCDGCEAALGQVFASPLRKDDRARDVYRHPSETLAFLGVRPDMKVGEFAPGGEWYSRLLGLYLGEKGNLVGLYADPVTLRMTPEAAARTRKAAEGYPADVASFTGLPADRFAAYTLDAVPEAEKGTFDHVLIVRMLHNMMRSSVADSDIKGMRDLLKPGGLLGIVQHRAKADAPFEYANGANGYLREEDVIKFVEANGFELVATSEINANPNDSANWPGGVWTLPPTLALKDTDRAKYQAIGESDRMTLLFRKRP